MQVFFLQLVYWVDRALGLDLAATKVVKMVKYPTVERQRELAEAKAYAFDLQLR